MLDATFAFHIESFVIALGVEFILDHTTGAFHKESCCGEFYTRYQGNWFLRWSLSRLPYTFEFHARWQVCLSHWILWRFPYSLGWIPRQLPFILNPVTATFMLDPRIIAFNNHGLFTLVKNCFSIWCGCMSAIACSNSFVLRLLYILNVNVCLNPDSLRWILLWVAYCYASMTLYMSNFVSSKSMGSWKNLEWSQLSSVI